MSRIAWAALLAALALAPSAAAQEGQLLERGRDLYARDCLQCHGPDGRGVAPEETFPGTQNRPTAGPSLRGVGARSAHLYLTTGYMPLREAFEPPERAPVEYSEQELDALVAYVDSLGGGPDVPEVAPSEGDLAEGFAAYTSYCAGCHQSATEGGVVLGGVAPPLNRATAVQIAEAIRVGPYLMPSFSEETIDDATVASIARYVLYAREPRDEGGWGIGHLGPIPEGIVAWVVAGLVLIGVARALGQGLPPR